MIHKSRNQLLILTIPTDFMIVDQKLAKKQFFLTVYFNNLDIKQKTG
jgi:hypothetical protein